MAQCFEHSANSTVLLRCFGANCNVLQNTHFLCYLFGPKFESVLFFTLFPSLIGAFKILALSKNCEGGGLSDPCQDFVGGFPPKVTIHSQLVKIRSKIIFTLKYIVLSALTSIEANHIYALFVSRFINVPNGRGGGGASRQFFQYKDFESACS